MIPMPWPMTSASKPVIEPRSKTPASRSTLVSQSGVTPLRPVGNPGSGMFVVMVGLFLSSIWSD